MTGRETSIVNEGDAAALRQGRSDGLAFAALALSLVSFTNLLGAEKAILAIVLAVLALRSATSGAVRTRSRMAIALASIYIVSIATVLVIFREELTHLIQLLQDLG
jgi:hypothetical protein